ncbi:ribonuclease Oy-like [Limulus polyphemus]|uniref:Ribonuclease Oy-like n=1 Tax=Limulus polyphemus TaxID=6850 RepID=A0ABM1BEY3_LIMPO|nr:ribonuclease Oy-like [Limulus polyphemus]
MCSNNLKCNTAEALRLTACWIFFLTSVLGGVDYLMFVQDWPPTVCLHSSKFVTCEVPSKKNNWVIHGLWPSSYNLRIPRFCNSRNHFNLTEIQGLVSELENEWPNLYVRRKASSFWKYEWEKHGTCAAVMPYFNSQKKYFSMVLKLKIHYDLFKAFKEGGITPSREQPYMLGNITNILKTWLKAKVVVKCQTAKHFEYPVLHSIRMCMNMTFKLIDCPASVGHCKANSVLYLPIETINSVKLQA